MKNIILATSLAIAGSTHGYAEEMPDHGDEQYIQVSVGDLYNIGNKVNITNKVNTILNKSDEDMRAEWNNNMVKLVASVALGNPVGFSGGYTNGIGYEINRIEENKKKNGPVVYGGFFNDQTERRLGVVMTWTFEK